MSATPAAIAPVYPPGLGTALLLITAAASFGMLCFYDGPLSYTNLVLALLVTNLAMLPGALYFTGGARSNYPLMEMISAYLAIMYGWTAFSGDLDWLGAEQGDIQRAFTIALAGVVALLGGFYLSQPRFLEPLRRRFAAPPDVSGQFHVVVALLFLAAADALSLLPAQFKSGTVTQLTFAFYGCGLSLGWLRFYAAGTPPAAKLAIALLTALLLASLTSGAGLKLIAVPVVLIAIAYWRAHHRLPIKFALVVVAFFLVFNPVKPAWRAKVWSADHQVTLLENIGYLQDAFEEYYFGTPMPEEVSATTRSINRLSDIAVLTRTVEYTPSREPYWRGESLKALPYSLIPRLIWPDKPVAIYGNIFGRRYDLIGRSNYFAFISLSWITELFINFGMTGVIMGMALIGYLVKAVQTFLGSAECSELHFAIGVGAGGELFNPGQNLSLIWGALPLRVVLLYLLYLVMRRMFVGQSTAAQP